MIYYNIISWRFTSDLGSNWRQMLFLLNCIIVVGIRYIDMHLPDNKRIFLKIQIYTIYIPTRILFIAFVSYWRVRIAYICVTIFDTTTIITIILISNLILYDTMHLLCYVYFVIVKVIFHPLSHLKWNTYFHIIHRYIYIYSY